jgi:hypothetical protein
VLPPSDTVQAADIYPILDVKLDYYKTSFPAGLRYSQNWYGTFAYAPPATEILLFDDTWSKDWGMCIFSMPFGVAPSGEQGGTTLAKITLEQADAELKSYSVTDAYEPFDVEIIDVMPSEHHYTGAWAGNRLKQKFEFSDTQVIQDEKGDWYKVVEVEKPIELEGESKTTTQIVTEYQQLTESQSTYLTETKDLELPRIDLAKYDPDRFWVGNSGNWSDNTAHWSASSGGAPGASIPTSADNVSFDVNSFTLAGQTVTVDATAYCLSMDWTGALNTPTLTSAATMALQIYGSLTFIANMSVTGFTGSGSAIILYGSGAGNTITTAGQDMRYVFQYGTGTYTVQDNWMSTTAAGLYLRDGTFNTNNKNFNISTLTFPLTNAKTITFGSSTINCTSFTYSGTNLTITANTANINISGTGDCALGDANWNGASFNLTGTAHTVSGSPTGIATFTRTGTATKTDTVTFTSGENLTCGTFAMIGNSITNRLLVQSSTLGTPATITATNWTGSANVDIMDITVTNPVDLSAITGGSGDCQGNTDITFTTAADQISAADGNASTLATWQDGVGTDRVPLPQDSWSCSHNLNMDMPRAGKSITFTGIPTITRTINIYVYGSLNLVSSVTMGNAFVYLMGRGNYNLTTGGGIQGRTWLTAINGIYSLQDTFIQTTSNYFSIRNGTLNLNNQNISVPAMELVGATISGNGTATLSGTSAAKWNCSSGSITGSMSFILTNSGATGQTFAGGGLVYNNITVQGAGNYALTVTGNNRISNFHVDASLAAKTIIATGTSQLVDDFTRDTGTGVVTLTGGTWSKSDTTPLWLDYLTVTGSTANATDTWFAGQHSTDGGGNTAWIFDDPAITVETISATGITMDKDGVTGGTLTGNVTTLLDGTPRIPVHAEVGLTAAYGTNVTGGTIYDNGLFTISVPATQTPGATYHYRMVGETGNGTSPFEGADDTYVYTMPTVTTVSATPYSVATSGATSSTLTGSLDTMGVASSVYVFFNYWGYTSSDNTTISTLLAPGTVSLSSTGYDYSEPGYYRVVVKVGDTYVYGGILTINEVENSGLGAAIIAYILIMGFIAGIAALSKDKKGNM